VIWHNLSGDISKMLDYGNTTENKAP
jgi:hypothetical protein